MKQEIYKSMAGWYVVIHKDYDSKPQITGPFTTIEEADQELKEYLQCLPTPHTSSLGLSSR